MPTTDPASPTPVEDTAALVGALARLAQLFDEREWDRLGEVLAPDVVAYGEDGLDAVVANALRRHLGGCGPTQHLLGNHQVTVDGDAATSRCEARVHHQGAGERSGRWWECMGAYSDRWRRTPAGWRMTERRFDVRITLGDPDVLQPG